MMRAAIVCLASLVAAQQPLFRSGIDAVRIDVSVMNGVTPVTGLAVENFEIVDNGVRQNVASLSLDTVPLNLMLLLDVSASMRGGAIRDLIDAADALILSLRRDDRAALITFSEPVRLAVPLTHERERLSRELEAIEAGGATSLNDAVFLALQWRPDDIEKRTVLLVFSDGHDTSSWLSGDQLLDAARRSGIVIHVVELAGVVQRSNPFTVELAAAGGGRRWSAASSRDLQELFGRVLNELRARYLLTYFPSGVSRPGWHDVTVSLKGARGDVTARPGYFMTP